MRSLKPEDWRLRLSAILRKRQNQALWISFNSSAELGIFKAPHGLMGSLRLSGKECWRKVKIMQLLRGYRASNKPQVIKLVAQKPQRIWIVGLTFADEKHVVVVVENLIQQLFPVGVPEIRAVVPHLLTVYLESLAL